jgi:thiosulfate reductase cytochrome b subunit
LPGSVVVALIVAAVLMVGGLVVLGIPGAIYAVVTAPVAELLRGLPAGSLLSGDRAWPLAIVMTLAVPPALPLAVWLVGWLRPAAGWLEAAAWVVGGVYLWALAVVVGLSF